MQENATSGFYRMEIAGWEKPTAIFIEELKNFVSFYKAGVNRT